VAPAGLTWPQAALLAGLLQAPSADNPVAHFTVARAREAHVLGRLVATGTLTQAQAARAYRAPLHLVGGPGTGCAAPDEHAEIRRPASPGPRQTGAGGRANAG
jgi:membrane peptidoglycan carboxypeptidase